MDEVQKLNACCFLLIKQANETNAKTMTITQEKVTYLGKDLGDWKITVEKVTSSKDTK